MFRYATLALAAALAFCPVVTATTGAQTPSIEVLSAGAVKSAVEEWFSEFGNANKIRVTQEFVPVGPIMKRLADGATPDVVVLSGEAMDDAIAKGLVVKGSQKVIGCVGIGVAIKTGAPRPDISTPEAFKATLLASKSIVYVDPTRGTSGKHFASVLEQLGIADAMKAKTTLGPGGYVVEPVGRGEIELGVHQISEILPVPGVTMIGPLPGPLQKVTKYVMAVGAKAKNPRGAAEMLDIVEGFVSSPMLIKAKGFDRCTA